MSDNPNEKELMFTLKVSTKSPNISEEDIRKMLVGIENEYNKDGTIRMHVNEVPTYMFKPVHQIDCNLPEGECDCTPLDILKEARDNPYGVITKEIIDKIPFKDQSILKKFCDIFEWDFETVKMLDEKRIENMIQEVKDKVI